MRAQLLVLKRVKEEHGTAMPYWNARAAVRIALYDGWHESAPMRNGVNNRGQRKHRRAS